jgi:hypothetical protein
MVDYSEDDSDDIIKRVDKVMKEITEERNKIRAELGEPLIDA